MKQEERKLLRQLGARLHNLRKERGITQIDLANEAGLNQNYVGMIERGEKNPTYIILMRLAKVLEISPSAFFEGNK